MLSGPVFALEGALLGLTTGAPVVTTNPVGSCTYDDAGQVLTIETQPFFITFDGIGGSNVNNVFNTAGTAPGGIATYTLNIDNSGNLTVAGSTVTVSGLTQDTLSTIIYGPTLLTGDITDFGIRDDGVNDVMDIQATFSGGDLGTRFPQSIRCFLGTERTDLAGLMGWADDRAASSLRLGRRAGERLRRMAGRRHQRLQSLRCLTLRGRLREWGYPRLVGRDARNVRQHRGRGAKPESADQDGQKKTEFQRVGRGYFRRRPSCVASPIETSMPRQSS